MKAGGHASSLADEGEGNKREGLQVINITRESGAGHSLDHSTRRGRGRPPVAGGPGVWGARPHTSRPHRPGLAGDTARRGQRTAAVALGRPGHTETLIKGRRPMTQKQMRSDTGR